MTELETTDMSKHSSERAEMEVKSIQEQKKTISQMQEKTSKHRPKDGLRARDSTSINPQDREPIDPQMPEMPPA